MIALRFRDVLPPHVANELDSMIAQLKGWATREHNEDGTHRPEAAETHLVPTGAGMVWYSSTAPSGWLICDGTAVSRVTYAALFEVIGITYGAGDGVLTFNLPDLRQRFPLGKAASGTGSTLGSTGGNINHTHTGPSHTHSLSGSTASENVHTHNAGGLDTSETAMGQEVQSGTGVFVPHIDHTHHVDTHLTTSGSAHSHGVGSLATGSAGTGDTGTANPPYQVVNYIIKT